VLRQNLKEVVILGVEGVFLTGRCHHRHVKRPAAGDDAHHPWIGLERCQSIQVNTAVQRQEIDALFAVLPDDVKEEVGIDVRSAPRPSDSLVDRDGSNRRIKLKNPAADAGEVSGGREVHQGVCALA